MKKWKIEAMVIVGLLLVACGVFVYLSGADQRRAEAEYEQLLRVAQRQSIEIALIEQGLKLKQLKQQVIQQQPKPVVETPSLPFNAKKIEVVE